MRKLIKNGNVHLEDKALVTDVLVQDGLIEDIGKVDYRVEECQVIDARGLDVLPGLIDIHTHLDDTIGKFRLADDWRSGSRIAVANGITTLCSFITQREGRPLREAVESALDKAGNKAYCDHAFHLTPVEFGKNDWAYLEKLMSDGFRSFKFYTTYREAGLFMDYGRLQETMTRLREMGAAVLVHCEDDENLSRAKAKASDPADPYSQALSRPAEAEIAAIKMVLDMAGKAKCRCHIVHVSTAEGARLISRARQDIAVTCETCPQYLFLNDGKLKEKEGHRYICSPPLRPEANRREMAELAAKSAFDIYATDHCAFGKNDKDRDKTNYSEVPNGLAGIGALVPLTYELHQDLRKLALHLSLGPAKVAGLYPQKGAIRKGADADLVLFNEKDELSQIISSNADAYEVYNMTTRLKAKKVFLRGELVAEEGVVIDPKRFTGIRV